jgi:hypothetical protein
MTEVGNIGDVTTVLFAVEDVDVVVLQVPSSK